jgi:hypothetical protein
MMLYPFLALSFFGSVVGLIADVARREGGVGRVHVEVEIDKNGMAARKEASYAILDRRKIARSEQETDSLHSSVLERAGPIDVVDCPSDFVLPQDEKSRLVNTKLQDEHSAAARGVMSMRGKLGRPKTHLQIGCMIITYRTKRQFLLDVLTTWAQDCNKVYAFSDETWDVPEIGFTTIEVHPNTGGEAYRNVWRRTQQMWIRMAEIWPRDNLDFLLVGGEDMFFIMPNVRVLLEHRSTTSPTLLGNVQGAFVSGAGYIVNQPVVDILSTCIGEAWNITAPAEDVMVSRCLRSNGVDSPSSLARMYSKRFCSFGICRTQPDTLLYHYVGGKAQSRLFNALFGHRGYENQRQRMCAPLGTAEETSGALNRHGWTPRLPSA